MSRLDISIGENFEDFSNRGRAEKVAKRQEENEPTRFYHVTPVKFKVGEYITPVGRLPSDGIIFLSDNPLPHYTIVPDIIPDEIQIIHWQDQGRTPEEIEKLKKRKWYCYEVEPEGPIEMGAEWNDLICRGSAKVIRFIGDARAMLENYRKQCAERGIDPEDTIKGSIVHSTKNIPTGGYKIEGRTNQKHRTLSNGYLEYLKKR